MPASKAYGERKTGSTIAHWALHAAYDGPQLLPHGKGSMLTNWALFEKTTYSSELDCRTRYGLGPGGAVKRAASESDIALCR